MPGFVERHAPEFTRASVASVVATGVEFVALALLAHHSRIPHWVAYAAVQFLGTAITFVLNKYWAFDAAGEGAVAAQGLRSLVVFGGSFALNTALPSVGSYLLHREPVLAFAVSQALVYVGWNYPMNRFWVFRKKAG